jgi:cysteine-rich repeat protein
MLAGETIRVTEHGTIDAVVNILQAGQCGTGSACAAGYDFDETVGMFYTAKVNGPVYISLESYSGSPSSTSSFDLDVEFVSFCGDSVVEASEGCDDGNQIDGDGCSSICQPEATSLLTACAGTVVSGVATLVPVGIPNDLASGGAILTVSIPASGTIQSMALSFTAQHTAADNIDVWLSGPNGGGERDVTTDNGSSGHSYIGTLFEDGAPLVTGGSAPFSSTYEAEQAFSFFTGQSVNGIWTVRVADDAGLYDLGAVWQVDMAFCVTP